jgi:hypothetical protein
MIAAWLYQEFRAHTLCAIGVHCKPSRRVQKYDGGRGAQLCRFCYLVLDTGWPQ